MSYYPTLAEYSSNLHSYKHIQHYIIYQLYLYLLQGVVDEWNYHHYYDRPFTTTRRRATCAGTAAGTSRRTATMSTHSWTSPQWQRASARAARGSCCPWAPAWGSAPALESPTSAARRGPSRSLCLAWIINAVHRIILVQNSYQIIVEAPSPWSPARRAAWLEAATPSGTGRRATSPDAWRGKRARCRWLQYGPLEGLRTSPVGRAARCWSARRAARTWWASCRCRGPCSGSCSPARLAARTAVGTSSWHARAAGPARSAAASSRRPCSPPRTAGTNHF